MEDQIRAAQAARAKAGKGAKEADDGDRVGLTEFGRFDKDIYGSSNKFAGFTSEVVDADDSDDEDGVAAMGGTHPATREAMRAAGQDNEAQREKVRAWRWWQLRGCSPALTLSCRCLSWCGLVAVIRAVCANRRR